MRVFVCVCVYVCVCVCVYVCVCVCVVVTVDFFVSEVFAISTSSPLISFSTFACACVCLCVCVCGHKVNSKLNYLDITIFIGLRGQNMDIAEVFEALQYCLSTAELMSGHMTELYQFLE